MLLILNHSRGSASHSHDDLKFLYDVPDIYPQLVTKFKVICFIQSLFGNLLFQKNI